MENPALAGTPEPGFLVRVTTETKTMTYRRANTLNAVVFGEFRACSSHMKGADILNRTSKTDLKCVFTELRCYKQAITDSMSAEAHEQKSRFLSQRSSTCSL